MPDRVIVEPNPPRQGYSHLTWNGLNEYYLQKAMDKDEYVKILQQCKKIAFQVYAINREENRFLQDSIFAKLSNVVWASAYYPFSHWFTTSALKKNTLPGVKH